MASWTWSLPTYRLAVTLLLGAQLLLYFVWTVTQFEAIQGSWWQPFFHKSGPVLLPILFGMEIVLVAASLPLLWRDRRRVRQNAASALLILVVVGSILTIPLAYLQGFDPIKIWKDVAFASGFLNAAILAVLSRKAARTLFFYYLCLSLLAGGVALAEAIRRGIIGHETAGHFLLHTYRIYAGGHFEELLILFAAVAALFSYSGAWRRTPLSLLVLALAYLSVRFRLYFTRLYWISLALALPVIVLLVLPRRALRASLMLGAILAISFIAMTPLIDRLTQDVDLSTRLANPNGVGAAQIRGQFEGPTGSGGPGIQQASSGQDTSLSFRIVESRLLWDRARARPLTGWGPGGTISPNVPDEPLRNNTSSFFNGYLGVAYKFGAIVLIGLVGSVVLSLLQIRRALRTHPSPIDAVALAGAGASLVGVLTTSLASDILFANFSSLAVGLMIGIGGRLSRAESVQPDVGRPVSHAVGIDSTTHIGTPKPSASLGQSSAR